MNKMIEDESYEKYISEFKKSQKTESKIEQFEVRNTGAKQGGRKHKKNPFRRGCF